MTNDHCVYGEEASQRQELEIMNILNVIRLETTN